MTKLGELLGAMADKLTQDSLNVGDLKLNKYYVVVSNDGILTQV